MLQNASYKALAHSVALAVIFNTFARLVAYIVRFIEFVVSWRWNRQGISIVLNYRDKRHI
jgi:hypothetical protein